MLHISFGNRALRGELSSRVRVRPRGSAHAERPETTRRVGIDELDRPRWIKSRDEEPSCRSGRCRIRE